MSKKSPSFLRPDWESLDEETLKKYRIMGIVLAFIGGFVIASFVPTVKFWFKLLGAGILGLGLHYYWTANHYLKK